MSVHTRSHMSLRIFASAPMLRAVPIILAALAADCSGRVPGALGVARGCALRLPGGPPPRARVLRLRGGEGNDDGADGDGAAASRSELPAGRSCVRRNMLNGRSRD